MAKYRVTNGLNLPDGCGGETRHEFGDTIELSPGQADALSGSIEKVSEPRPPKKVSGGAELPTR